METMGEIESSGSNVDEAIAAGLALLAVTRENVEVEVLDEGSRGLLGLGARPARVRMVKKVIVAPEQPQRPTPPVEMYEPPVVAEPDVELAEEIPAAPVIVEEDLQAIGPIGRQTLEELLDKMGIRARVEDYIKPPLDEEDSPKLVLNVQGGDLGVLIGRRGETLEALQYLTRIIVGREVGRRVNLIVDVEGYRVRRERSLQQLAMRMAERAVTTGRRQVLEPMTASERRIVHMALRHHAEVTTESVGEDENRKVTIFLRGSK